MTTCQKPLRTFLLRCLGLGPILSLLFSLGCNGCGANTGGQEPSPALEVPAFDANAAWTYLQKQVGFGPREPGSIGHQRARDYLLAELGKLAEEVIVQDFTHSENGYTFDFTNLIGRFNAQAEDQILLGAHWDTRPFADQDPNPANWNKPILGANDGASGVAVLLGIARALKVQPPPVGVVIVFFDAEDAGGPQWGWDYCLGSAYFASHLSGLRPDEAIVIDMIGDANLTIPQEPYSQRYAPDLLRRVYDAAEALGYGRQFPRREQASVFDDHIPLNYAGIPAIDLIDFEYPEGPRPGRFWHTLEDTVDKCSPYSLKAVGEVLLRVVYETGTTSQGRH